MGRKAHKKNIQGRGVECLGINFECLLEVGLPVSSKLWQVSAITRKKRFYYNSPKTSFSELHSTLAGWLTSTLQIAVAIFRRGRSILERFFGCPFPSDV